MQWIEEQPAWLLRIRCSRIPFSLSGITLSAGELDSIKVSVGYGKAPLKLALEDFREKAGLELSIDERLISRAQAVTLRRENTSAEKVFLNLLRPEGLETVQVGEIHYEIVQGLTDQGMR